MLKKQIKVVINDCNHPSIEIERKILSEINTEVILLNSNKKEDIIKIAKDAEWLIFLNYYQIQILSPSTLL